MTVNDDTPKAIRHCIEHNVPFAYVRMPSSDEGMFFASEQDCAYLSHTGGDAFVLREFCINPAVSPISIPATLSPAHVGNINFYLPAAEISPVDKGVDYATYIDDVNNIIHSLRLSGGKTVYSRLIAKKSDRPLLEVICEYFDCFPDTMRFVYFTRHTGLWFGASPELILDYNADGNTVETMALAGTRSIPEDNEPWDEKNVNEHDIVTAYIIEKLRQSGLSPEIYDSTPVTFGNVQHLCDRIRAVGDVDAVALLDSLSPTPALCGLPCQQAYNQIIATEKHNRHCYGGWIGVSTKAGFRAFVNLRSAFVAQRGDGWLYNIYVGGGLTSQSVAEDEWEETVRKSARLCEIIDRQ